MGHSNVPSPLRPLIRLAGKWGEPVGEGRDRLARKLVDDDKTPQALARSRRLRGNEAILRQFGER